MMMFKFVPDTISGVALLMVLLFGGLSIVSLWVWGLRWQGRRAAWGTQILSWWWMFPLISLAWWCWPWGGMVLALLIGGLALRELGLHTPNQSARRQLCQWGTGLLLLQTIYAVIWPDKWPILVGVLGSLCVCMAFFWRCANDPSTSRQRLLGMVFLYQATGIWAAVSLNASTPSLAASWFWWLCILTALNDVAQFITGKCLGRHKVTPSISPNKTWQGLMGGLVASAALAWSMGSILQLAAGPTLLGLGLALSAVGFLGDLSLSAVKRHLGIKDFSDLIPGHGGILDRVDSLILTAPALFVYLHLAPLI